MTTTGPTNSLNSSAFGGAATIVRNGCRVANRADPDTRIGNRTYGGLTPATGAFHAYFTLLHSCFMRFFCRFIRRLLGSERSSFSRTPESSRPCRRLSNQITFQIGDRYHRVVERCRNVDDPNWNVLLFLLTEYFLFPTCCFSHKFRSVNRRRDDDHNGRLTSAIV